MPIIDRNSKLECHCEKEIKEKKEGREEREEFVRSEEDKGEENEIFILQYNVNHGVIGDS